ncbi:MAG: tetratricopeptide (TPR) repeat protein [Patiriisocius sp.]|jgi:tetratricopeptide (TPR) repeat protein
MNSTKYIALIAISVFVGFTCLGQENSSFSISQAKMKDTQGKRFAKEFKYTKAISKFTEAIDLDHRPEYSINRANAFMEIQKLDKARSDFKKAIATDSTMGLAYLGLAKCLIREDINNDSLNWYLNQALHFCIVNEDQALTITTLAELKMAEGDYKLAKNYVVTAHKLDPSNVYTSGVYARVAFELNEKEKAIEILEGIVESNDREIGFLINLGYLYNNVERYDDAMKVLERAIFYEPDNPYVLANFGYTLFMTRRLEVAKKAVDKSIKNDPSNAYGHFVKGLLALDGENVPKACKCFNRAMDRVQLYNDRSFKEIKEEIKEAVTSNCDSGSRIN